MSASQRTRAAAAARERLLAHVNAENLVRRGFLSGKDFKSLNARTRRAAMRAALAAQREGRPS